MKNVFCVFLLMFFALQMGAQEIKVESFRKLENDMDAKIHHPKEDWNGEIAAIIKVVTTESGFTFDTGSIAVVDVVPKVGEIWIYVQEKVKKMTIKHPLLGVIRDYQIPIPIKKATVYEMKLVTSKIRTIVEEDAGGQYWVLTVTPKDAEVTIDNGSPELLTDGVLQKLLQYGKHIYTVNAPLYEPTGGEITIGKERVMTSVELVPGFGYLEISSSPVTNTDVYLNGEKIGKAPLVTQRLPKGSARIRVVSGLYQPVEKEVIVPNRGDTLACPIVMSPNFAEMEFVTEQDVAIYVNDKRMANGVWKDKLVEGMYKVEARKPGYRTIMKSIKVVKGQNQKIEFEKLTPVYGKVDISTGSLANVKVLIDGKDMGIAPNIFPEVLIGKHQIRLIKEGYKTYQTELNVEEGKLHNIKAELEKELWGDLVITSSSGATIIVNGIKSLNQYTGKVKAGKCKVSIAYGSYNKTEDVEVLAGRKNEYHYSLEGKLQVTSTPSKARVRVDGIDKGTTPIVLDLYGKHEISVFKGNKYRYASEGIYVSPIENSSKHFSLKRIPNDLYSFWMYTASPSAYYGGMIGICRTFGWYAKGQYQPSESKDEIDWNMDVSKVDYNTWTKEDRNRLSITSGPMVRLAKWMYLYAGAGYGDYGRIYSGSMGDYNYSYFCPLRCKGLEAEGGVILKIGGFILSCGYSTIFSNVPVGEKQFGDLHIGIGFTINHSK